MKKEMKEDIFSELRSKNYVTTSELKQLSLNYKDINFLIDNNYLKRLSTGYYKVNVTGKDFDIKKSKLKLARTAIKEGNFKKAYNLIKSYSLLDTSSRAHYALFQLYLLEEDYVKAKEELLISITLDKDSDELKQYFLYIVDKLIESNNEVLKLKKQINTKDNI